MTTANLSLLAKLSIVSRLDGILAQIRAERGRVDAQEKDRNKQLSKLESDCLSQANSLEQRKNRQQREETQLNEERQKLMDRRKALSSFSGQKVQQAAEREISAAAELLNAQEEGLIQGLSDIENLEAQMVRLKDALDSALAEGQEFANELTATRASLDQRQSEKEAKRAELLAGIDPAAVSAYTRVRDRFPQNAVVPIRDKACSGCFQSLVAQTLMQVQRGDGVIKCQGCGRILCLESHLEEGKID